MNLAFAEPEVIDIVSSSEEEDEILDVMNGDTVGHHVTIPGPPKALARPTFMNWMQFGRMRRAVVNKSKPKIKAFRQMVKDCLHTRYGYDESMYPLFPTDGVTVILTFYRRVPNSDFKQGKRDRGFVAGRFPDWADWVDLKKPDLDNLVKFVLDALSGVVYADDAQVVKLVSYKLMHTSMPCNGKTELEFMQTDRERDLPNSPFRNGIVIE